MIYTIQITQEATADMRSIYSYIAFKLLEVNTALQQSRRTKEGILSLSSMPERYRIYDKAKFKNLRMMPVDHYSIFYSVDTQKKTVNILRVLYGKMNFDAIL